MEVVGEVIKRHSCTQPYMCSLEGNSMHARDYIGVQHVRGTGMVTKNLFM